MSTLKLIKTKTLDNTLSSGSHAGQVAKSLEVGTVFKNKFLEPRLLPLDRHL